MRYLKDILLGILFGYLLGRAGVTEYAHILGMFSLTDFHMYGVLGTAVPTAGVLLWWMKKNKVRTAEGAVISIPRRARHPGNLPGGILFGIGWAITGACPGTSLVQVGTGHLLAGVTVAGLLVGLGLYTPIHNRFFTWQVDVCG